MRKALDEAEEYELFGYPNTQIQDCIFMENIFKRFNVNVHDILDIACGTGRHAIEMTRRGYTITAIDISENMLTLAKKKAEEQNIQINFQRHDMTKLKFKDEFDAAYILFNTMITLVKNQDLIDFMEGINKSLRIGGLFIIEVGNLWAYIAKNNFKNGQYSRTDEKGEVRRKLDSKTIIGPYNNIYSNINQQRYWRNNHELEPKTTTIIKRAYSINELDLLFRLTNFKLLEVYGATDINKKIEDPDRIEEVNEPYSSFVLILQKT